MQIVRFAHPAHPEPMVGVSLGSEITLCPPETTIGSLLRCSRDQLRSRLESMAGPQLDLDEVRLLAPVDGRVEVWAAGVTYENSRLARMEESEHEATIYERVYEALRPELFFKTPAWKARGHGEPISVRRDSPINVPEPEAAVVLNAHGEVVGLTVCDDVSSRSIEAENPLYLPQAKIYAGACAVGPGIRPIWEVDGADSLAITLTVRRAGAVVWSGDASTAQLKRGFTDLAGWLFAADEFPEGVVLSTGTCLVPALPFTLEHGDEVEISLAQVGTLVNTVTVGLEAYRAALRDADQNPRPSTASPA